MKLFEIASKDFFDHSNPAHVKMMAEIDAYTATARYGLSAETIKFLESKYKDQTGSELLYRAFIFDSLDDVKEMFGVNEEDTDFTYKRDKESSWTKRKAWAYRFAQEGDFSEQYTVVISSPVRRSDFLLDVDDLSKRDLEHIYLEDQAEVIVNNVNRRATIVKIIDNWK